MKLIPFFLISNVKVLYGDYVLINYFKEMGDPRIKHINLSKKLLAKRTSDVQDKSQDSIAFSLLI